MGQYKVPQNVEAEDKIIGFLTMKQFIYAVIGVAWGLVSFTLFRSTPVVFALVGIPPTLLFLMLGLYQRQDQPFEVFLLALIAYLGKPRRRVWEKEPLTEVFKVEAPIVRQEVARRDPSEVRGQLDRLARIVDSRGFNSKQPELQEPRPEDTITQDDRLTTPTNEMSEPLLPTEVGLADDILDLQNNPSAQNLDILIQDSNKHVREEAIQKMKQSQAAPSPNPPQTKPSPTQPPADSPPASSISKMTQNPLTDILRLAMENSDLTVSQIEKQAQRRATLAEGETVSLRSSNPGSPAQP